MNPQFLIIGAGGVGSWLIHPLAATFRDSSITIMDGDILEEKNLDRQRFNQDQVGKNKAEALVELYPWANLKAIPHYFHGDENVGDYSHILGCADNNEARLAILNSCDCFSKDAVIGANEYFDSQAYYYKYSWCGGRLDPRVKYPDLLQIRGDSPINCTGEAQMSTPQLCLANFNAAGMMLRLLWTWIMAAPKATKLDNYPFELRSSIYNNTQFKVGEK